MAPSVVFGLPSVVFGFIFQLGFGFQLPSVRPLNYTCFQLWFLFTCSVTPQIICGFDCTFPLSGTLSYFRFPLRCFRFQFSVTHRFSVRPHFFLALWLVPSVFSVLASSSASVTPSASHRFLVARQLRPVVFSFGFHLPLSLHPVFSFNFQ